MTRSNHIVANIGAILSAKTIIVPFIINDFGKALKITLTRQTINVKFAAFHFSYKVDAISNELKNLDSAFAMEVAEHDPSRTDVHNHLFVQQVQKYFIFD